MITLYEMSKEWQDVFEMLLDPEIPEEAVFDTIEMIEADMDTKADSYAKIIKSMDGDTAQIDTEIKRLQERKTSINNRQKALKQRLFRYHEGHRPDEIQDGAILFQYSEKRRCSACGAAGRGSGGMAQAWNA